MIKKLKKISWGTCFNLKKRKQIFNCQIVGQELGSKKLCLKVFGLNGNKLEHPQYLIMHPTHKIEMTGEENDKSK